MRRKFLAGLGVWGALSLSYGAARADGLIHPAERDVSVHTVSVSLPASSIAAQPAPLPDQEQDGDMERIYGAGGGFFHSISNRALFVPRTGLHPATPECIIHAVAQHHLPLSVVVALMRTEGGHPGTVHVNSDKYHSRDLGVMQVNDRTWLKLIADHDFNGDQRSAFAALRDDGCYNVMWGTEIFSRAVDEAKGRYWLAVGYYNSHNEGPRLRYTAIVVNKFMDILKTLQTQRVISAPTAQKYEAQANKARTLHVASR